jgi:hypothetical protein
MTARWQRREFLRAALLQLGAWPLASALGCGGDIGSPDRAQELFRVSPAVRGQVSALNRDQVLLAHFEGGNRALVAEIGERYLRAFATDRSDQAVLDALASALSLLERPISDAQAISELARAIRAEFTARNVADLHGWTCAPTELALCALLWIAAPSPAGADSADAAVASGDAAVDLPELDLDAGPDRDVDAGAAGDPVL